MLKRFVFSFAAVMNLLLLDQVVKEFAVRKLKGASPVTVIPNLFSLGYVENRGMAWGLLQGYVWPLALFACDVAHNVTDYVYPVPTVAMLRLQMYSNLAYGAQGLQYYRYYIPKPY